MAFEAGSWRLFGVDLLSLGGVLRSGWEDALQWPALAWFSPQESVRVLLPDGSESRRLGATAEPAPDDAAPEVVAVVLPESDVLVRELRLPRLSGSELRQALALEVAAVSPFPPDQVVWGWRADPDETRLRVRLAMAARTHVDAYLDLQRERLGGAAYEVWVDAGAPIVMEGYAEGVRALRLARQRRRIVVALGFATVLSAALAATPVLQARQRVFDAQAQYAALEAETVGLVASRNALALANERAGSVNAYLQERPDIPKLIEVLTLTLPDEAFLSRLEVQGRKVRIVGQAGNASQLMDALGVPGSDFLDVRAPSPISRVAGADRESFVIEFVLAGAAGAP